MSMMRMGRIAVVAIAWVLGSAPMASALTVSGGGINSVSTNFACTTTSPCLSNKTFGLQNPGLASGTINVSGSTATISLSVPSFSMSGPPGFGGIDEIDFTNVAYNAVINVTVSGSTITGGGQLGTVAGTYEQKNLGSSIVGPTAFNESASFLALNCSVPGGVGVCALQVGTGASAQFDLDINGAGLNRFVNTFNLTVVPEPASLALVASGLLVLAAIRRRAA